MELHPGSPTRRAWSRTARPPPSIRQRAMDVPETRLRTFARHRTGFNRQADAVRNSPALADQDLTGEFGPPKNSNTRGDFPVRTGCDRDGQGSGAVVPTALVLLPLPQVNMVNVLLAIDESIHSEAAIAAVCKRFSPETARIRLVHVVEWPRGLAAPFSFAEGPSAAECVLAVHDAMRHAGRDLLKRGETHLRNAGFEVVSQLDEGDVRQVILEDAAAWPADMIVLGSHGRTGFNRFLLGSVSESVVRHAPCSVEIVREQRAPGPVKPAVA